MYLFYSEKTSPGAKKTAPGLKFLRFLSDYVTKGSGISVSNLLSKTFFKAHQFADHKLVCFEKTDSLSLFFNIFSRFFRNLSVKLPTKVLTTSGIPPRKIASLIKNLHLCNGVYCNGCYKKYGKNEIL